MLFLFWLHLYGVFDGKPSAAPNGSISPFTAFLLCTCLVIPKFENEKATSHYASAFPAGRLLEMNYQITSTIERFKRGTLKAASFD